MLSLIAPPAAASTSCKVNPFLVPACNSAQVGIEQYFRRNASTRRMERTLLVPSCTTLLQALPSLLLLKRLSDYSFSVKLALVIHGCVSRGAQSARKECAGPQNYDTGILGIAAGIHTIVPTLSSESTVERVFRSLQACPNTSVCSGSYSQVQHALCCNFAHVRWPVPLAESLDAPASGVQQLSVLVLACQGPG